MISCPQNKRKILKIQLRVAEKHYIAIWRRYVGNNRCEPFTIILIWQTTFLWFMMVKYFLLLLQVVPLVLRNPFQSQVKEERDEKRNDFDQKTWRNWHATQMKLRESSNVDPSKNVKELTKSPRRATKYATIIKKLWSRAISPVVVFASTGHVYGSGTH